MLLFERENDGIAGELQSEAGAVPGSLLGERRLILNGGASCRRTLRRSSGAKTRESVRAGMTGVSGTDAVAAAGLTNAIRGLFCLLVALLCHVSRPLRGPLAEDGRTGARSLRDNDLRNSEWDDASGEAP